MGDGTGTASVGSTPNEDDPTNDPDERRVVCNAVNSFHRYRDQAHYHITHKRRQAFYALPQLHWQLLSKPPFNILSSLELIDAAIDKNAEIAEAFVASGLAMYELDEPAGLDDPRGAAGVTTASARPGWQGKVNPIDQEKAHSTIKQLYRDWSAEGAIERDACYRPVLRALDAEFSDVPLPKRGNIKVLVPGAGLGRSVYEIVRAGYAAEGNEISYHQLIASNFFLNFTQRSGQFELYPWIHGFSNHESRADQLQKVLIPDVHPATELQNVGTESDVHPFERISFCSADFCVAYKQPDAKDAFDAVATIFFVDTAPNVVKYVEAVHHCLKPGGIWINLGPLKWHFENSPTPSESGHGNRTNGRKSSGVGVEDEGIGDPGSVELTEEELVALVEQLGFLVQKDESTKVDTGYMNNTRSMWQGIYKPSFWVARKLGTSG